MNIEGPILYYRTDIFKKCGVEKPATIKDVEAAAEKIKACDSTDHAVRLARPEARDRLHLQQHAAQYRRQLHRRTASPIFARRRARRRSTPTAGCCATIGPPGVVNYSFQQISALYRSGRAAMSFESSNELRTVMDGGERLKDTGLAPFPAGEAGQVPTAIGWGMAVSAYSKQPDAGLVLRAMGDQPGDSEAHGAAGDRAAAAGGRQRSGVPQVDRRASRCARNGRPRSTCSRPRAPPRSATPSSPIRESREFIGQAVQDLILKQKTVDQACADADKALDALIAQK